MPTNNHLLTLFVLGTLSVTLDLDVKLCGQVSLGTEELCFAAVLVYTILTRPRVSGADVVEAVASDDNEGAVAWDIPVVKALRGSGFLELLHRRVMVHAAGLAGS